MPVRFANIDVLVAPPGQLPHSYARLLVSCSDGVPGCCQNDEFRTDQGDHAQYALRTKARVEGWVISNHRSGRAERAMCPRCVKLMEGQG